MTAKADNFPIFLNSGSNLLMNGISHCQGVLHTPVSGVSGGRMQYDLTGKISGFAPIF
jgi:hypothetical protein